MSKGRKLEDMVGTIAADMAAEELRNEDRREDWLEGFRNLHAPMAKLGKAIADVGTSSKSFVGAMANLSALGMREDKD